MKDCPACARTFEKLEDFPLIVLQKLTRLEIPDKVKLPFEDRTLFAESEYYGKEEAPGQVVGLLENSEDKLVEFDGWNWYRMSYGTGYIYKRRKEDIKDEVAGLLEPYLQKLEGLVGNELPTSEFVPPFERDSYFKFSFRIPDTGYNLALVEGKNDEHTGDRISRVSNLTILGQGFERSTLRDIVSIARLEYEGKVIET